MARLGAIRRSRYDCADPRTFGRRHHAPHRQAADRHDGQARYAGDRHQRYGSRSPPPPAEGQNDRLHVRNDLDEKAEAYYDQRITQRLILQPRAELNFAAQDVRENRLGSGLSEVVLGLRLRYEIRREFAPYVGISWERRVGDTTRFQRAAGEDAQNRSFVADIRFWF